MENMFTGAIYQNRHGGALAAYAPPQQYAAVMFYNWLTLETAFTG
jgi:hypothetical protein